MLVPAESDDAVGRGALAHHLFGHLVLQIQLLHFLVSLLGQKQRAVLPTRLIDFAALIEVDGGVVGSSVAAH